METTTTKKKVEKKAAPEVVELTKEEKMLKAFGEDFQDIMFEHGLFDGLNIALSSMFNHVSAKYDDMDTKIMEICGALEMARSSIMKTKENSKKDPEPKEK